MFSSFKLFEKESEKYLRLDFSLDVKVSPTKLILELESPSAQKQFIKAITKKTSNGFKIMRRLTTVNLLIIYSPKFIDLCQAFVNSPFDSSDKWLNDQCIRTYYRFLKKIVASQEMFVKSLDFKEVSFQKLFYLIHLMSDMFKIVSKMPLLGRYFKESNQIVTCSFVEGVAMQAQKLYTYFKASLLQILSNHKVYIKSRDDQKLTKAILEESLPVINQEMKKLFLDKYFYPYGKGIGIRLFRTEQQNQQTIKIISGIISDHKQTQRRTYQQDLQTTLFPEDGKVNMQFYERTLKPSESKNQQIILRDLDEIQEQQYVPTKFDDTTIVQNVEKAQKSTSDHMQIVEDV